MWPGRTKSRLTWLAATWLTILAMPDARAPPMSGSDRISNPAKLQLSFLPVTGTGSLRKVNESLFSFFQRRPVCLEAREPHVPNRFHAQGTDKVYRLVWVASDRFG